MTISVADARAEALFASDCQPSQTLASDEVEAAVRAAVKRLGLLGCACAVAAEFGDHPDVALKRMLWARKKVAATWPGAR
jgi:hypothetical protein